MAKERGQPEGIRRGPRGQGRGQGRPLVKEEGGCHREARGDRQEDRGIGRGKGGPLGLGTEEMWGIEPVRGQGKSGETLLGLQVSNPGQGRGGKGRIGGQGREALKGEVRRRRGESLEDGMSPRGREERRREGLIRISRDEARMREPEEALRIETGG